MTKEYKTLRELNLQPGDVVCGMDAYRKTVASISVDGDMIVHFTDGDWYLYDGAEMWRIVSRAPDTPQTYTPGERQAVATYPRASVSPDHAWEVDDTPKLLRDMTDAEIGALVRAKNEGKVIECFVDRFGWYEELYTTFDPDTSYRVRPEPKRETRSLYVYLNDDDWSATPIGTIDMIDGKPDCDSIKMEEL